MKRAGGARRAYLRTAVEVAEKRAEDDEDDKELIAMLFDTGFEAHGWELTERCVDTPMPLAVQVAALRAMIDDAEESVLVAMLDRLLCCERIRVESRLNRADNVYDRESDAA